MKKQAEILAQLMLYTLTDCVIKGTVKSTQSEQEIKKFVYPENNQIK